MPAKLYKEMQDKNISGYLGLVNIPRNLKQLQNQHYKYLKSRMGHYMFNNVLEISQEFTFVEDFKVSPQICMTVFAQGLW